MQKRPYGAMRKNRNETFGMFSFSGRKIRAVYVLISVMCTYDIKSIKIQGM